MYQSHKLSINAAIAALVTHREEGSWKLNSTKNGVVGSLSSCSSLRPHNQHNFCLFPLLSPFLLPSQTMFTDPSLSVPNCRGVAILPFPASSVKEMIVSPDLDDLNPDIDQKASEWLDRDSDGQTALRYLRLKLPWPLSGEFCSLSLSLPGPSILLLPISSPRPNAQPFSLPPIDRDMALLWHYEEVGSGSFAVVGFSLPEDAASAGGATAAWFVLFSSLLFSSLAFLFPLSCIAFSHVASVSLSLSLSFPHLPSPRVPVSGSLSSCFVSPPIVSSLALKSCVARQCLDQDG